MDTGDLEAVELQPEHVLITDSEFGNCPLAVVQFIRDVRALPSIWDRNSPKYDTHERRQSWTTLCRKSYPQFDNRSEFEKTLMGEYLRYGTQTPVHSAVYCRLNLHFLHLHLQPTLPLQS